MPLTVGGGIKSIDDMTALLKAGADKVSLNSAALANPELITEGAQKFGNQCMVVAIDVKTDEETKNHPLPLLRRNSNIKRCILCIWNAFSWRTGLCLLPLSILQFLCRGTSGNQDTKRNARQPGASSKADSGTSNFRSDLATGHPFQTGSISLGGR